MISTDCSFSDLGPYNGLGVSCGPHTASSYYNSMNVTVIVILQYKE